MANALVNDEIHINVTFNHEIPVGRIEINLTELIEPLTCYLHTYRLSKVSGLAVTHSPCKYMEIVDYMAGPFGIESAASSIDECIGNLAVTAALSYVYSIIVIVGRKPLDAYVVKFGVTAACSLEIVTAADFYVTALAVID